MIQLEDHGLTVLQSHVLTKELSIRDSAEISHSLGV